MEYAAIRQIDTYLPGPILSNDALALEFQDWTADKILEKTGIQERHIARKDEFVSDMAVAAAEKVFQSGAVARESVDYLLLCTQSPDYLLPTTACLVQQRLNLPTRCGALDFNLGCSGFVYGLGLAQGLVETRQAGNVLLITAETYSKHIHPKDKSVRTIFGDAAAATLISATPSDRPFIGPFLYGTDGTGAANLIVPTGGMRSPRVPDAPEEADDSGNIRTCNDLYMNGAEIFTFTLKTVPAAVAGIAAKAGITLDQVDLFVFHQANEFMLEALRKKIRIPREKFVISMKHCGNTVSSTLPITLAALQHEGRISKDMTLMLVGFGVGYSWGATIIRTL